MAALQPKDFNINLKAAPHKSKQTVSASRILKTTSTPRYPNPIFNPFRAARKRKIPKKVHPLVKDVNESLDSTSSYLLTTHTALLSQTHSSLLAHLATVTSSASTQADTRAAIARVLSSLPSDQVLRFVGRTGEDLGSAKLGARVAAFKRKVGISEAELTRLWAGWEEVQREVDDCVGVLKGLLKELEHKDDLKEKWMEEVDRVAEEAIERMRQGEQELQARTKKQRVDFMKVLDAGL